MSLVPGALAHYLLICVSWCTYLLLKGARAYALLLDETAVHCLYPLSLQDCSLTAVRPPMEILTLQRVLLFTTKQNVQYEEAHVTSLSWSSSSSCMHEEG